ncbi:MAG TPA: S8 family serine peptidase [Gemmatimonadaceae bacterium]|jgi:subtilisin family serine protease
MKSADHHIIQLKGAESADFAAMVAKLGGQIERRLPDVKLVVVKGLSTSAASTLASRTDVSQVTLDSRRQWIPHTAARHLQVARATAPAHVDQSGAAFFAAYQWNMRVTKANQAWLTTPEGRGAKVYVLDTGIDPNHLDLAGLVDLSHSTSFAEAEPNDIKDYESHGTFVSAIIASNGIGVASVAPLSTITAVKVLDQSGSGSFADVISGIVYAANQGADVINMSLGSFADLTNPGDRTLVAQLQAAIAYARLKGAIVVAAAGNDGLDLRTLPPQDIEVPAELLGVVSVGATGPVDQMNFDRLASYSNYGWNGVPIGGVQVFAPGGDFEDPNQIADLIISACSEYSPFDCGDGQSYLFGDGTSFSSPMVSGEAAVLRSIVGSSTLASLVTNSCVLQGTDVIGPSGTFGEGRMDVVKAASCAHR